MNVRLKVLWKVPVFCSLASVITFFITIYSGKFFTIVEIAEDGTKYGSTDPVRSTIFTIAMVLIVLLAGGLWYFRSMTKAEIALSAAIMSVIYLVIHLMQIPFGVLPGWLGIAIIYSRTWQNDVGSLAYSLVEQNWISIAVGCLAPLLFVPFGKKSATADTAEETVET